MPNSAGRPWKILLPLAAFLFLCAAWPGYWFIAIGIAKDRAAAERTKLAENGLTLGCTTETWGGFPFHFEFTCSSPILTLQNKAEARSGNLLLVALAYAPWQIVGLLDGPTSVMGEGLVPTTVQHQRIIAAVTFDRDWKPQLSAEITMMQVPGLGKADNLMVHARPSAEGGVDIAASATGVVYQREGRPDLTVAQGDVLGTLKDDQVLKIEKFELKQNDVRYWGTGNINLDQDQRIAGKLSTETNDLNGLLGVIEPYLDLTDNQKTSIRTVLGLLGNEAKADIIARDGQLFVGPFRVAELRSLY